MEQDWYSHGARSFPDLLGAMLTQVSKMPSAGKAGEINLFGRERKGSSRCRIFANARKVGQDPYFRPRTTRSKPGLGWTREEETKIGKKASESRDRPRALWTRGVEGWGRGGSQGCARGQAFECLGIIQAVETTGTSEATSLWKKGPSVVRSS